MSKILAVLAVIGVAVMFALPARAASATDGIRKSEQIDLSAAKRHRRHVRRYYVRRYYYPPRPYLGFGYPSPYYYGGYYGYPFGYPYPYYRRYYRPGPWPFFPAPWW